MRRSRRGLSSVVGTVFMVLILMSGLNIITFMMNGVDSYNMQAVEKNRLEWERIKEDLEVLESRIDSDKFNITVRNSGSITARLVRLWVNNQTASPTWRQNYDLNTYVAPGQTVTNVGQQLSLIGNSTYRYDLKLVTERGNLADFEVNPDLRARVELIVPGGVLTNSKFTVMFVVNNNLTSPNNMLDVTPTITHSGGATIVSGPTPGSEKVLGAASTVAFTWVFQAPSTTDTLDFNASLVGAPPGVYSNTTSEVFKASEAEGAQTATFAAAAKRLGILISGIPNPIKTGGGSWGKFGIGVVNPLNRTVEIFTVALSSPHTKIADQIVGNRPTTGWSIESPTGGDTIIYWQDSQSIVLGAYEVYDFRVEIEGKNSLATEAPIYIEALTSEGKFILTYLSTYDSISPTINLFYTGNPSNPNSDWKWTVENITGGVVQTFNVTVQNSGDTLDSYIKLLIIVPEDWTNVTASSGQSGWGTPTLEINFDGSTLITVDTTGTTIVAGNIRVFKFDAVPPVVSAPVIFVLVTTTVYPDTTSVRVASAISETAVQIVP